MEASTQAFLVCSSLDTYYCSPSREDTQLPSQQATDWMDSTRNPKAEQRRQHHIAHLQNAESWAGGTQDSWDAAMELLPPTSSYASHPLLQHHQQPAVQTWEAKPRTAAGGCRDRRAKGSSPPTQPWNRGQRDPF